MKKTGGRKTISRRTLIEWIGSAAVLSLSSPLIAACARQGSVAPPGAASEPDALAASGGTDAATDTVAAPATQGGSAADSDPGTATDSGPATDIAPAPQGGSAAETTGGSAADSDPGTQGGSAAESDADSAPDSATGPTSALDTTCDTGLAAGSTDTHSVFEGWGERTVDPQELADLLAGWELSIEGMVENPVRLGFCDLLELGLHSQVTDFHCVEGWSIYDVPWDGVPLSVLLDMVRPKASATHLKILCETGKYTESLALDIAREPKSILALGINEHTLPLKHGFPARVVVPRLLGYKNPKYVTAIELVDYEHEGFWSAYGYPVAGLVPEGRLRPGKF